MDSPQSQIWGPHFWIILHSLAERIGQPQYKRLAQEEIRLWSGLLASLRYSLPCPLCKKHFTNFFTSNHINVSKEFIREWLYKCHNNINVVNEKPLLLTIEELPNIYSKPFNFSFHFNILMEHMTRAIRMTWCNREDVNRTVRFLQEMKRFYDLF